MDGFGFSEARSAIRKKRSNTSRRPRSDSQQPSDYYDISSLSSTPPSDTNIVKHEEGLFGESDEASNNGSFRGSNDQRHSRQDSRRCSEGVLAPANWKSSGGSVHSGVCPDGVGCETKVKKVTLKVGGITRTTTINPKSTSDGASAAGSSSTRSSHYPDLQSKVIEDNLDEYRSFTSDRESDLRGVPWKSFSKSGLSLGKTDGLRDKTSDEVVRKSKRVRKKRPLHGMLDDDEVEDDDEIRYLEKVRTSKMSADYGEACEEEDGGSQKQCKISRVLKRNVDGLYNIDCRDHGPSKYSKESKKSRTAKLYEDTDYVEEEELVSDGEPTSKKKRTRKEFVDLLGDPKQEIKITTRQRALQTGKDVSSYGIEFPNGLPPAPPKKQKEELSEVDQQLKRAEALQRRRMQVEKAARESEAEAIRKILGQDSSRKKREDKMKKRQEELAQEKAANAMILSSDHVRWVMGPSGTVVTFPNDMGLPSILNSKPCSYPPPREKCAGPSCNNPYKYRDSKSKLPLCSLRCYKAIHENRQPLTAC
ncbi:hypothetical protein K2173_027018 [Erythroxylum novogranatense]|uniref:INO80 complex subunit B-like conserved region domain-containing protein n=1 Tax=Erythroxylum novogranatense TaxID=1862640 RepID=A0AAV8TZ82_9ROSI|nr:hypothetical protein K2173_027018 [Erythroxylum novogranatense]